jgi:hypothetical protein
LNFMFKSHMWLLKFQMLIVKSHCCRFEKDILRRRLLMERAADRAEMRELLNGQNALMMEISYNYGI